MNVGSVTIPVGLTVASLSQQVNTARNLINGLIGPANSVQGAMANIFTAAGFNQFLGNFNFLRADLIFWAKMTRELTTGNTALRTVLGNLSLPSSLTTGLTDALTQLRGVSAQLQTQFAGFSTLSSQIIESASSLSLGQGINPIMGPGMQMGPSVTTMLDVGQGIEEYVGFEKIANSFKAMALAGGESTQAINGVMEETKRLGAVTSKTPTAVAGLAGELSKLGFASKDVSQSLEGITRTSEATGEDLVAVGSVVAVALNSFKIPTEKTALVSDKMAAIANASATSVLAIGEAVKYVGSSAYAANQSLDTTLVSLGLLSSAGIEGSMAGTGLVVAMTNLQKAAAGAKESLGTLNAETAKLTETDLKNLASVGSQEEGAAFSGTLDNTGLQNVQAKALNALGLDRDSLLDAEGNLRQLTDIIPVIKNRVLEMQATAEGTAKVPVLINALFGQQGGRTIQALLGQTEADVLRLMESARTAEGFSSKVSQVMLGGLSGSLEQLSGSVQTVSLIVGEFFAPAFKVMVDATLSVVNAFASLPGPIRNFTLGMSVVVPLAILYWKTILASKSIMQAYTAATVGLTLAKTALGRAELVNIITTSISEAKAQALLVIYSAQGFALSVLTGRTSLQAAANIILANSIRLATTAYNVNTSTVQYALGVVLESIKAIVQSTVSIGLWITKLNVGTVAAKLWGMTTFLATNLINASIASVKLLATGIYSMTASIIASIRARTLATAVNKAETAAETAQIIAINARTLASLGLLSVTRANTLASIAKNKQLIFELLNTQLISVFTARSVVVNKLQLGVTWANVLALKAKIFVLQATIVAQNIYAVVTGRATTANLGFIASTTVLIARFALIAAAAWAVSQAWNSFTSGTKEANGIQEAADSINKLTKEITGLEVKTNDAGNIFQKFWAKVQQKGPIEAVQQGLSKITGGMPNDSYGKGEGITNFSWTTKSQLAAQRAMFATEQVSKAVNAQLELGIGVMQKYGLETIEASDKQRLGTKGIADFKAEATKQVEVLGKTLEALKAQQPVNDEQKAFIQTNIKLTEQQVRILRGKIVAIESETATTKVHILTLKELTQKYEEVAHASQLSNLNSAANIEEMTAKGPGRGGISQEEGSRRLSVLSKSEINERVQTNDDKLKDLKAASIGASTEDANKIAEEIKKIEIDQLKARIDSAKYEQQVRKKLNEDILGNVKEREDSVIAKQQLSSQSQITAIRKAQAARTLSAEEAAAKITTIESADLQASIARETEKQQKLNQLRQWGVISEEEARKGMRESVGEVAKIQGQIAEAGLKKIEEQSAAQLKTVKDRESALATAQELSSQIQVTAIKKAQAARVYTAEEAAIKLGAIENADLQASINREIQKQQNINQLRQRGLISEEEARKGLGESAISIAKTQGQLAEAEVKRSEERVAARVKAIEEQSKLTRLKPEQELAKLETRSFASDQQAKMASAQSGVGDARSELDKQRLGFALQLAELNGNQSQQEQVKNQIYQQQLVSLTQQQQAKRQELAISQQQAAIELERKRVQSEIAVLEAQSALQVAQAQGASAGEIAALQQSIALKQQIVAQVATEKTNQQKLNSLSEEQLAIQQQTAKEGLEQQRQIDLQRQAIERKTKAIEEGVNRARALSETQLQGLDFKGQDIGAEVNKQKLLTDISQSQSNLQKQRLEFSLQTAELSGNESTREQIKEQIYQQQQASLIAQHQAQKANLELSSQQAAIELERKRIQGEIALLEAQANLELAKSKNASETELAGLQSVIALREKSNNYISTEEANQAKVNQLTSQHLSIEQQVAQEGLKQQRQIELQKEAIEKKTKAIEEGLNRARALSEAQSQKLEFKGQDIGAEISKQKLLADISQSQSTLQKQRLEFGLQLAELAGNESTKEQITQQIYQQQQASLVAQHQAQKTGLQLSNQQATIELERKRIAGEIALLEAQANLESAQAKNASAAEIASLQAVIALRQKSVDYISTEEANQNKINQLTSQHLTLEQQIAREGLEQQRHLEMQKLAIEKRTKAIEEGLIRSRTALEGQSQNLEFKGQAVGGEIDEQKGSADLQQSQAAYQKQQLDFALQRAELTGNESAKEQVKEQIYQQQKAALVAQQQAQIVGIGLSRQQAAIELERQKLSAQIALTEAQANVAKAQITKTTSAAEMESLRATVGYRQQALGQITAQAAVSEQVRSTEDQKLAIERQTTMENLVQTRQLELQKEAIDKQKQAIEERLQAQKSGLENRQGKLELSNQLLDLESRQLSARSGLAEASNGLEQQRLEFLMSQAEITGNTAQKESLKTQLYQQQLAALDRSQLAQQQSFEISQKQKQIELDRQEIQAKIATFEAEANVAKAKADNSSAQQISALEAVYNLRQEALTQVGQMRTAEGQIVNLERQKLMVEQFSTREKMRQTRQLEKMKEAHDKNNKAAANGTGNTSGGRTWIDDARAKGNTPWNETAKNPFQEAAEQYFAALPPSDLVPIAPDALKTNPLATQQGKTPNTPQQLANMQIAAQNVYLTGTIAETAKPADGGVGGLTNEQLKKEALAQLNQRTAGGQIADINAPIAQAQPMDAAAQREAAKAKIEQAQSALSAEINRQNAEARSLTIDPAEAARQGLQAAASARDYAAQIRADLKSGALKNQVNGQVVPLNLPPTLGELASNLANAQAALKEIKDPVTVESIYKSMEEIKDILKNLPTGNLTVVSQNPVAECGEILSALTRRR